MSNIKTMKNYTIKTILSWFTDDDVPQIFELHTDLGFAENILTSNEFSKELEAIENNIGTIDTSADEDNQIYEFTLEDLEGPDDVLSMIKAHNLILEALNSLSTK